jgi:DNA-binding GntR family transcriptional regulator
MTTGDPTNSEKNTSVSAVSTISAEEAVTVALRNAILTGRLAPGERLAQADLAEQLGVSRIPLRDALRRLEEEALVRIDGRRGAWVTALDEREIAEIYELRILLEAKCARYAINNLTKDDATKLIGLSYEMDRTEHDDVAGRAARRAFYAELYSHSGRPRMARLILQLRDNVSRYHVLSDTEHSHGAHEDIRRCIETGDASGAVKIVTTHLEEARDDLLKTLAEELRESADH